MAGERVSSLPNVVRLMPSFDVDRLVADLGAIEKHFMGQANSIAANSEEEGDIGGWDVLPLRCPGGDPEKVGEGLGGREPYADAPYLDATPYVREILDGLDAPIRGVRFSALAAGAMVHEHSDRPYGLPIGWLRFHVPVRTNERAILFVNREPHCWQPGEFWYANFGMPHALDNKGTEARVHLIIDCYVSDKLFDLFPEDIRGLIDPQEAIFFEEEQPLPAELADLNGTILLPPSFLTQYPENPSQTEWDADGRPPIEGQLDISGGRIVLHVNGREVGLAHIGDNEFRPVCWTRERSLTLETRGGAHWTRFRCRRGSTMLETGREQPLLRSALVTAS